MATHDHSIITSASQTLAIKVREDLSRGNNSTPVRLCIMLSGKGRTLAYLNESIQSGVLQGCCSIGLIIASRECAGAERARAIDIETRVIEGSIAAASLDGLVHEASCSLVILAGYLRKVAIPHSLHNRIVNIHPGILTHGDDAHTTRELALRGFSPRLHESFGGKGMFGDNVHQAVLNSFHAQGTRATGCTVHLCDDQFDHGPILLRRTCPILNSDTVRSIADRTFVQETVAYPEALAMLLAH